MLVDGWASRPAVTGQGEELMQDDTAEDEQARPRDRGQTSRLILDAAKAILAEEGFSSLGINAVARRAGCDKQLIYRYFGGLNGLVDAIGADLATWVEERMPEQGNSFLLTYGDLVERLLVLLFDALTEDPLMRKIIAWEVAESTAQVRRLSEARGRALAGWLERVKGDLAAPKGTDAPAINAMLIGAVQHAALSADSGGRMAGLALDTPKDRERARSAIRRLVRGVYP